MKVCNLASGSKGNVTYIEAGKTKILIDAGLCVTDIEKKLNEIGVNADDIDAVFVTHEHVDHVLGLARFVKKHDAKVVCHESIVGLLQQRYLISFSRFEPFVSGDFFFGELTISPIEVSHDSLSCFGFALYHQGKKVSIATDVGKVTKTILNMMEGSDIVLLEANHDLDMLMNGSYTASLKRRIISSKGHLSNVDCGLAIKALSKTGTQNFVLCHLSEKNNSETIAKDTITNILKNDLQVDVKLQFAKQHQIGTIYDIK